VRATVTHFRGRAERWLDVDREVGDEVVRRMREERPDYLFAALTGVDKASHAGGHEHGMVTDALTIVDGVVDRLRADAERGGWWDETHLWVVSDHGHSPVHTHSDLVGLIADAGHRAIAHPWSAGVAADVAVMVSGNAMAHLYVELQSRDRPWWPRLAGRWESLVELLLSQPAVDLVLMAHSDSRCEIRSSARGSALVERRGEQFHYRRLDGDPLRLRADVQGDAAMVHDATVASDYPDAVVQILALAGSARAGDLILSAAPGFDFRARYEPIPHRSAHGALHRDHMLVPLLTNRPPARRPRRTTDLFASALAALGVVMPPAMDGLSFL
jgi:arylsulfatase A-like enzyme